MITDNTGSDRDVDGDASKQTYPKGCGCMKCLEARAAAGEILSGGQRQRLRMHQIMKQEGSAFVDLGPFGGPLDPETLDLFRKSMQRVDFTPFLQALLDGREEVMDVGSKMDPVLVVDMQTSFLPRELLRPREEKPVVLVVMGRTPQNPLDDPAFMEDLVEKVQTFSLLAPSGRFKTQLLSGRSRRTHEPTLEELTAEARSIDGDDYVFELLRDQELDKASADVERSIDYYNRATEGFRVNASGRELAAGYIGQKKLTLALADEVRRFLQDAVTEATGSPYPIDGDEDLDPLYTDEELAISRRNGEHSNWHRWGSGDETPQMRRERSIREDDACSAGCAKRYPELGMDYMPAQEDLILRRDGTVFLADVGDGIVDWEALRPIKPRPRPSKYVLIRGPQFDKRIRQLATSWQCTTKEAQDRFFGWGVDQHRRPVDLVKPNHLFPVRRVRQFEE